MSHFLTIGEKLEDFRRQLESSRRCFRVLADELRPLLSDIPELDARRVTENNRIIETFLTSIKNTIDFNIERVNTVIYDQSMEDLSKNFFTNCFKNENYDNYEEFNNPAEPGQVKRPDSLGIISQKPFDDSSFIKRPGDSLMQQDILLLKPNSVGQQESFIKQRIEPPKLFEESFFKGSKSLFFDSEKPGSLKLIFEGKKKRGPKILNDSAQYESESISEFKNEESENSRIKSQKTWKRGPYRAYGIKLKQEAIKMLEENGKSLKEVSEVLKVPTKNIKRWLKVGPLRKKGGGRKTMDPEMESQLFEWCINEVSLHQKPLSRNEIKQQAKQLSFNKGIFKASKGWLDKFMKRFDYSERVKQILGEKHEGVVMEDEGGFQGEQEEKKEEGDYEFFRELKREIKNKGQKRKGYGMVLRGEAKKRKVVKTEKNSEVMKKEEEEEEEEKKNETA